jgi:hypothetical protein
MSGAEGCACREGHWARLLSRSQARGHGDGERRTPETQATLCGAQHFKNSQKNDLDRHLIRFSPFFVLHNEKLASVNRG